MQQADRREFQELMGGVMALYRQDVSTFALSVWWQACERFDIEQVRKAMTAHAMDPDHGQYPPKPADIVRQLQGTAADRSLIAWGKVLDAIQRVGAYQSVCFDDGAIHASISDMGGWPAVCHSKTDELPFLQRRFCDAHRAYSARPDHPYPARLIGMAEQSNAVAGYPAAPPMFIGDAKAAARVQQTGSVQGKTEITASDAVGVLKRIGRAA